MYEGDDYTRGDSGRGSSVRAPSRTGTSPVGFCLRRERARAARAAPPRARVPGSETGLFGVRLLLSIEIREVAEIEVPPKRIELISTRFQFLSFIIYPDGPFGTGTERSTLKLSISLFIPII